MRAGQSWSSWADVPTLPETMDFEGPNGLQQTRQGLVRWARDFQKQIAPQDKVEIIDGE